MLDKNALLFDGQLHDGVEKWLLIHGQCLCWDEKGVHHPEDLSRDNLRGEWSAGQLGSPSHSYKCPRVSENSPMCLVRHPTLVLEDPI